MCSHPHVTKFGASRSVVSPSLLSLFHLKMESDPITERLYFLFKYSKGTAFTTTTKERTVTIGSTLRNLNPLIVEKSKSQVNISTEPYATAILVDFFFLWRGDPTRDMASSFLRFLDHTQ